MIVAERPTLSTPRVICAWCSRLLHDGTLPASHGICDNCRFLFEDETTGAGGRVAFFLGVDCGVQRHRFLALTSGWMICEWCGKQQSPQLTTCLICNEPGEVGARLHHLEQREPDIMGLFCPACVGEFEDRVMVADWELKRAG